MTAESMRCGMDGCEEPTKNQLDAFCAGHWARLARRHRTELVRLRNEAARGNQEAVRKFLYASAVARALIAKEQAKLS